MSRRRRVVVVLCAPLALIAAVILSIYVDHHEELRKERELLTRLTPEGARLLSLVWRPFSVNICRACATRARLAENRLSWMEGEDGDRTPSIPT